MTINFDTVQGFAYVEITPVKVTFTDDCDSTKLYISIRDNLYSVCQLTWHLCCEDGVYRMSGKSVIEGTDYTTWDGNPFYPFTFMANLLGLTIIE